MNHHDEPIPDLHFDTPLEVVSLKLTGEYLGSGHATGHRRYRLNRPLEPRETLKIEFELRWFANDFATDPGNTRLVQNGTYVRTSDVVPALGNARNGDPFAAAPPVAFRARIGTSLDQVAVTAGTLVRAWKENGWSFFEYESRQPIPPLTTIHSGHYAVQRRTVEEGIVEVFHHPTPPRKCRPHACLGTCRTRPPIQISVGHGSRCQGCGSPRVPRLPPARLRLAWPCPKAARNARWAGPALFRARLPAQYTTTERIDSPECIRSKALLISASGIVWVIRSSVLAVLCEYMRVQCRSGEQEINSPASTLTDPSSGHR